MESRRVWACLCHFWVSLCFPLRFWNRRGAGRLCQASAAQTRKGERSQGCGAGWEMLLHQDLLRRDHLEQEVPGTKDSPALEGHCWPPQPVLQHLLRGRLISHPAFSFLWE